MVFFHVLYLTLRIQLLQNCNHVKNVTSDKRSVEPLNIMNINSGPHSGQDPYIKANKAQPFSWHRPHKFFFTTYKSSCGTPRSLIQFFLVAGAAIAPPPSLTESSASPPPSAFGAMRPPPAASSGMSFAAKLMAKYGYQVSLSVCAASVAEVRSRFGLSR